MIPFQKLFLEPPKCCNPPPSKPPCTVGRKKQYPCVCCKDACKPSPSPGSRERPSCCAAGGGRRLKRRSGGKACTKAPTTKGRSSFLMECSTSTSNMLGAEGGVSPSTKRNSRKSADISSQTAGIKPPVEGAPGVSKTANAACQTFIGNGSQFHRGPTMNMMGVRQGPGPSRGGYQPACATQSHPSLSRMGRTCGSRPTICPSRTKTPFCPSKSSVRSAPRCPPCPLVPTCLPAVPMDVPYGPSDDEPPPPPPSDEVRKSLGEASAESNKTPSPPPTPPKTPSPVQSPIPSPVPSPEKSPVQSPILRSPSPSPPPSPPSPPPSEKSPSPVSRSPTILSTPPTTAEEEELEWPLDPFPGPLEKPPSPPPAPPRESLPKPGQNYVSPFRFQKMKPPEPPCDVALANLPECHPLKTPYPPQYRLNEVRMKRYMEQCHYIKQVCGRAPGEQCWVPPPPPPPAAMRKRKPPFPPDDCQPPPLFANTQLGMGCSYGLPPGNCYAPYDHGRTKKMPMRSKPPNNNYMDYFGGGMNQMDLMEDSYPPPQSCRVPPPPRSQRLPPGLIPCPLPSSTPIYCRVPDPNNMSGNTLQCQAIPFQMNNNASNAMSYATEGAYMGDTGYQQNSWNMASHGGHCAPPKGMPPPRQLYDMQESNYYPPPPPQEAMMQQAARAAPPPSVYQQSQRYSGSTAAGPPPSVQPPSSFQQPVYGSTAGAPPQYPPQYPPQQYQRDLPFEQMSTPTANGYSKYAPAQPVRAAPRAEPVPQVEKQKKPPPSGKQNASEFPYTCDIRYHEPIPGSIYGKLSTRQQPCRLVEPSSLTAGHNVECPVLMETPFFNPSCPVRNYPTMEPIPEKRRSK